MLVVAVWPAMALIVGAALGVVVAMPSASWVVMLAVAWAVSVAAFVGRTSWLSVSACVIGFGATGAALGRLATSEALEPPIVQQSAPFRVDTQGALASALEVEGELVGDAAGTEFGAALTVDVRGIRLPSAAGAGWLPSGGRVRVTVGGERAGERLSAWRGGRWIRAPMVLNAPLPYRNFGTIDQEQRLALSGIRLFGSVKSASLVDVVSRGHWWQEASAWARDVVRRVVARHVGCWDAPPRDRLTRDTETRDMQSRETRWREAQSREAQSRAAAIVTAILIGDRAGLDAATEARLQRAGTYHVIAISGGNIAILVTLATVLLRLTGMPPRSRAWLSMAIVILYALIVGSGASVARATLGAAIFLFARALDHRSAAINILSVAVALILVLAPLEVLDPAFWLTCVATLAILVCAQRIQTQLASWLAAAWSIAASVLARSTNAAWSTWLRRLASRDWLRRVPSRAWVRRVASWPWSRLCEVPVALLSATLAAEAWLLPITAYAFSQATAAGLALNFVAIPLMAVAQIGGLVVLAAAGWMSPIASAAGYVAYLAANWLVESAWLVDVALRVAMPVAMRVAPPPLWLVILAEVCGCAMWVVRGRWSRRVSCGVWVVSLAAIVLAPPWLPPSAPTPRLGLTRALYAAGHPPCATPAMAATPTTAAAPATTAASAAAAAPATAAAQAKQATQDMQAAQTAQAGGPAMNSAAWLRMTSLDVAQGDATLIRLPNGSKMLIDAGGSAMGTYDIGARIVSPALWALGLRRIDTLVLTHGDRDHIGGASAVLGDFSPREVWEGVPVTGHALLDALRTQATTPPLHARWRSINTTDNDLDAHDSRDDAMLRVLNPPPPDWQRRRVRNDDSIVLEITFGRVSIILPGDIGPNVERQLAREVALPAARPPPAPATLRILKAPHHGSGQSSTAPFLSALAPRVAIVSAGRGNRFGHPAPAALARYRAQDTAVFRTDQDGAIEVDTDGQSVFITTCSGRTLRLTAPPAPPASR